MSWEILHHLVSVDKEWTCFFKKVHKCKASWVADKK